MEFVRCTLQAVHTIVALCREFQISRTIAYKWLTRYRLGGWLALQTRSRRPHRSPQQHGRRCREAVRVLRLRWPRWGPKKLRVALRRTHPRWQLPAVSTIARWLKNWQLVAARAQRARRGPSRPGLRLSAARASNHVWTVDFKGWFRTGDGRRCDVLTVRDLYSRYLLGVLVVPDQSHWATAAAMRKIFARYGLPRVIRVDNGPPFAGNGALGLSRLSVWWLRLGITVQFTRRARPGDNAGHEQMHRILEAETARPAAATPAAQQRRLHAWRRHYNQQRPHEALRQATPDSRYQPSQRRWPSRLPTLHYPAHWQVRRVHSKGDIKWHGRLRFAGRAFVGEWLGLKPYRRGVVKVYLGAEWIGLLYRDDAAGMRPVQRGLARARR